MFSKVAKRVRRRSIVQEPSTGSSEPPREIVDLAPDLLRWCDFENPFPTVSFGGYLKYYKSRAASTFSELPAYQPALSKISLSVRTTHRKRPPSIVTAQLFSGKPKPTSPLPSPAEATPTPPRTRHLSTTSTATENTTSSSSPRSLRRKKATYLRSPSIERVFADDDFAQLFASEDSSTNTGIEGDNSTAVPPSLKISRTLSTDSGMSKSVYSDSPSNGSSASESTSRRESGQYANTPDTSLAGSDGEDDALGKEAETETSREESEDGQNVPAEESQTKVDTEVLPVPEAVAEPEVAVELKVVTEPKIQLQKRPDSRMSFMTAKSDFSDR